MTQAEALLADLDDDQKRVMTNGGRPLLVVRETPVPVGWREGLAEKRGKT